MPAAPRAGHGGDAENSARMLVVIPAYKEAGNIRESGYAAKIGQSHGSAT